MAHCNPLRWHRLLLWDCQRGDLIRPTAASANPRKTPGGIIPLGGRDHLGIGGRHHPVTGGRHYPGIGGRLPQESASEPIDRLVIALRAYVRKAPKKSKKDAKPPRTTLPGAINWRDLAPRTTPSDWVLVFDCETRTTPDQRLRFGAYELRYKGQVWERGAFYEPDVLSEEESRVLRQAVDEENFRPLTVSGCM